MPRSKRIKSLTDTYHIMIRGVNKEDIFHDDDDKRKFLQISQYYSNKFDLTIYAYCLMDNHVHFLIKSENNLNKFMQCIQTVYSQYFNKKYKRIGHLFQDRFKSIPVEENTYLLECVRYIHQNPVKAQISSIDKYLWSSYNEYIKKAYIIKPNFILDLFSDSRKQAIIKYIEYMNIISKESDLRNIGIEDKISDEEAIEFIDSFFRVKTYDIQFMNLMERNKLLSEIISLNTINILQISRITGIDRNILRKIDRKRKGGGPKGV